MDTSSLGPRRLAAGLIVLAAVGLVGGYGVATRAQPEPVRLDLEASDADEEGTGGRVFVHVSGAVHAPGVYELDDGARVDNAVRAAGGAREDADLDAVNLAAKVQDGDKVTIPVQGQTGSAGSGAPGSGGEGGKVNLNTATAAELESLPGIGPALAQRIVAHREQRGSFRTVRDLLKVSGIGPKKFEGLEDLVTV